MNTKTKSNVVDLPGAAADAPEQDPLQLSRIAAPPDHLDDMACIEWARLCESLIADGGLTDRTRGLLAGYCVAWSRMCRAEQHIKDNGEMVLDGHTHRPIRNPYLNIAQEAAAEVRKFAADLGFPRLPNKSKNGEKETKGNDKAAKARSLLR